MGYLAPLEFVEANEVTWTGEHRPEFVDLETIFRDVVHMNVSALDVGLTAASEAWRAALPGHVHIIRMLSPRAVLLHVPQAPLTRDIVLKVYLPQAEGPWRRLTERVERSRSHRAHLWAHRLRAIGIDTPRPLGYVEHARKPGRYPSFAATEFVLAPALIELKETGMALLRVPQGSAIAEKRALIARLALTFRALHAHRMFHKRIDLANLLVSNRGLMVVGSHELERELRARHASLRVLSALQRALSGANGLTRTDRLRFLRTYFRHHADARERVRAVWGRVLEAA